MARFSSVIWQSQRQAAGRRSSSVDVRQRHLPSPVAVPSSEPVVPRLRRQELLADRRRQPLPGTGQATTRGHGRGGGSSGWRLGAITGRSSCPGRVAGRLCEARRPRPRWRRRSAVSRWPANGRGDPCSPQPAGAAPPRAGRSGARSARPVGVPAQDPGRFRGRRAARRTTGAFTLGHRLVVACEGAIAQLGEQDGLVSRGGEDGLAGHARALGDLLNGR